MKCEIGYSKEVMKHFKNPKNMGEMKDADGIGKVGNVICGDVMYVYIKIGKKKIGKGKAKKEKEYIKDIKFQTMGCIAAIAASSIITELAKGKTLEEAKKITEKDINKELNLPKLKIHCSVLGSRALRESIENYEKKIKERIIDREN